MYGDPCRVESGEVRGGARRLTVTGEKRRPSREEGADGVTIAVRIGFDDSHSLGSKETGGRVALPVFQEVMLRIYRDQIAGPVPAFPPQMEQRITRYLQGDVPAPVADATSVGATSASRRASPAE